MIFGLFTRMHLVEQIASGVPRMRNAMKEANLPAPEFNFEGDFFTVTFARPVKYKLKVVNPNMRFSNNHIALAKEINKNSIVTIAELSTIIGVSKVTINKYIKDLRQNGIIDRIGSKTSGKWIILEEDFIKND